MTDYVKTLWVDEVPSATPIKYEITDDVDGAIAGSAVIEVLTPITPGTPLNAGNLNHMEQGIYDAQVTANAALAAANAVLGFLYPIGCIYISTVATNPNTIFGFGTWIAFGAGRTLVGVGTSDATYAAGAQGGSSTHQLTATEMPTHTHTQNAHSHTTPTGSNFMHIEGGVAGWADGIDPGGTNSAVATNQNAGGNGAHNNMPPYIVVYFWKRTA